MKELTNRNKPILYFKEEGKFTRFILRINDLEDGELFGGVDILNDALEKLGIDHDVKDEMIYTVQKLLDVVFKELIKRGYIKEK